MLGARLGIEGVNKFDSYAEASRQKKASTIISLLKKVFGNRKRK